jgi:hypothetical protein
MDDGTDAMNILQGNEHKLKHGFFAVKNRSQKDIESNLSV